MNFNVDNTKSNLNRALGSEKNINQIIQEGIKEILRRNNRFEGDACRPSELVEYLINRDDLSDPDIAYGLIQIGVSIATSEAPSQLPINLN